MDISDILDSVTSTSNRADPFSSSPTSTPSGQALLQSLTRAYINERSSPSLLPWPANNLIPHISALIKSQIDAVELLTGDMDPRSNFALIIIQTELERWKFLLRGLLRARLSKIDRFAAFYLSEAESEEGRMSEDERAYALRHQALLKAHYDASFLGAFPANLRGLSDTAGGISMIEGPDAEKGVFARAIQDEVMFEAMGRESDGLVEMKRGEVVVARWKDVEEGVGNGELELV
ncbi:hypothetical protein BP5796_05853 [Coleophoma crateriformis]|uniref:DNA replication complex GINS protein SLD5 n=1 Tax=Coleophoma crateriformis TaxID=565419 RepID=A0A3D8RW18_9HELO|nr:hypothetical protein BP5796_05853 [Coleophoma crateriformis]